MAGIGWMGVDAGTSWTRCGMLGVAWADLPALDEAAPAISADVDDGVRIEGVGRAAVRVSGVRDGIGPGHVWRATVDAATRDAVRRHCAMERIVGPNEGMVAVGGWCAGALVMDAKRRLFGPLTASAVVEAGACGAATMAARAAGHLGPDDTLHE